MYVYADDRFLSSYYGDGSSGFLGIMLRSRAYHENEMQQLDRVSERGVV